jgi:hypothetical protein
MTIVALAINKYSVRLSDKLSCIVKPLNQFLRRYIFLKNILALISSTTYKIDFHLFYCSNAKYSAVL